MRKTISAICFAGTVALLLLAACKRTVNYTELRSAVADSLRPTNIPGVLIAASHKVQPPNEVSAIIFHCKKACATKYVYWVQITYPVTVCYPPDIVIGGGVFTQGKKAPDSIPGIIRSEGTLTEMLSTRVNPLWCKTKYGPWFAEITDAEQCDNSCGEGSHIFTMKILGVQENISWLWTSGGLGNLPTDVNYIGTPFLRYSESIDCDLSDLTNCSGTGGGGGDGGGGHPAIAK